MNKDLLLKYLRGEADIKEKEMVADWLSNSKDNLNYFTNLKSVYVLSGLPTQKASLEEMEELSKIIEKGEILEKVTKKREFSERYFRFITVAASILLVCTISLLLMLIKENSINKKLVVDQYWKRIEIDTSRAGEADIRELYTEAGVKGFVILPDGSKVWLNSSSKILYPQKFGEDSRCVSISGEAYFDVVTDSLRPMIVSTNRNFKIKVTGTKFNVRSYDDDSEAQTTLISGSITLFKKGEEGEEKTIAKLIPEQSYIIRDYQSPVLIKYVDTTRHSAWKGGVLIFDQTPMIDVIKILHRWHGADFIIEDPELLKFRFTANFKSESLVQIMEMIKFCSNIDYIIEDRRVTLFDKHKK